MRIVVNACGEATMTGPEWLNIHALRRIARLARRLGLEGRTVRRHERARWIKMGASEERLAGVRRRYEEYVEFDGHEFWGHEDGYAAHLLDLVEEAGFDTILHSAQAGGGGYWASATDDDGDDILTLGYCFGKTRTQAAAGLALWAERATRPRRGVPRWGPRRAT